MQPLGAAAISRNETLFEVLEGLGQGLQVEERELEAQRVQSSVDEMTASTPLRVPPRVLVAGLVAGPTHETYGVTNAIQETFGTVFHSSS